MRVLFVSGELITGDLAYRLKQEGCDVKLFIEHPEQQQCLDGFVEKIADWKKELSWVGKDGLIVFDDVGYGGDQDALRKEGYRVVGGSEAGDKLEINRAFAQETLSQLGMQIVPTLDFKNPKAAFEYVKSHPNKWVVKQNNHQSALNYVGKLETGKDVLSVLDLYDRVGVSSVTLQERIDGIEIGIARYFNGNDWVGPIEMNVEHKSLFNGDIGPKTGEMGTVMWYDENENNLLYQATLAKLKNILAASNYRGDVDINVFVQEDKIYPIEITTRFGCPSTHLQGALHVSPWNEFLYAVANGDEYPLIFRKGYGVALTLALPPFPYSGKLDPEFGSEGLEVLFQHPLSNDEMRRIHFEGVYQKDDKLFLSKNIGYALFVSGIGETIELANKEALVLVEKVVIPKVFYRTDIGTSFVQEKLPLLRDWGWL